MVSAVATVVYAYYTKSIVSLTGNLVEENRLLRQAGMEPDVIACLIPNPLHIQNLHFVLLNLGKGSAKNVSFSIEADEADFVSHKVEIDNSLARVPITIIPPGGKVSYSFGYASTLFSKPPLRPFSVNVVCQNTFGQTFNKTSNLDISQFEGTVGLSDSTHQIAASLNAIARDVSSYVSRDRWRNLFRNRVVRSESEVQVEDSSEGSQNNQRQDKD